MNARRPSTEELLRELAALRRRIDELEADQVAPWRVQTAFREADSIFLRLAETIPAGVFVYQGERIRYANHHAEELVGYTQDEFLSMKFWDFVHPDERELVRVRGLARQKGGRVPSRYELRIVTKAGEERWLDFCATVIEFEGAPAGLGIAYDITERRRMHEALSRSEQRYRALVENINDVIFTLDGEGRVVYVSPAIERFSGYKVQDILGRPLAGFAHAEDLSHVQSFLRRALVGDVSTCEFRALDADGSVEYVRTSARPLLQDGRCVGITGVMTVISEQKRAEQALRRYTERLEAQYEIGQAVLAAHSPAEIAQAALLRLRQLLPCHRASVLEFCAGTAEGRILGVHADTETTLATGARIPLGPQFVARLRLGEIHTVEGAETAEGVSVVPGALRSESFCSFVNVPLIAQDELIGSLNLASNVPHAFAREHVNIAREIAGPLAIAIQNARLLERLRQQAQQLTRSNALITALNQVAARLEASLDAEQVMRILGADLQRLGILSFVAALDPQSGDLVVQHVTVESGVLALAEQLTGLRAHGLRLARERVSHYAQLVVEKRAVFVSDSFPLAHVPLGDLPRPVVRQALHLVGLSPGTPAILLPLAVEGRVFGILGLWGRDLQEGDIPAALSFAGQVSIALQNARLFERVQKQRQSLRALAARLSAVAEAERRQLARELHDRVGQSLSVLSINLGILRARAAACEDEDLGSRLDDSLALAEETAEMIGDVMADLRPPVLDDYGLVAALNWHGARFAARTGIAVEVIGDEPSPRLDPTSEIALFRIAQEALTNVAKHARTTRATVALEAAEGVARLTVTDNGVGFDPELMATGGQGWGLITMSERAESVGGRCSIESAPRAGTRVIVEVPR